MLVTKAEEAGSKFAQANTRKVKPTQRCHKCGKIVKKTLNDRVHKCECECALALMWHIAHMVRCECSRDENAAKTLLRWLFEGDFWLVSCDKPKETKDLWGGTPQVDVLLETQSSVA